MTKFVSKKGHNFYKFILLVLIKNHLKDLKHWISNCFLIGLRLHGKDWKKIEAVVGTRNGAQIRSHAQKFFSKVNKSFDEKSSNSKFGLFDSSWKSFPQFFNLIILGGDAKLFNLDSQSKKSSDDEQKISTGCAKKRELKEFLKVKQRHQV